MENENENEKTEYQHFITQFYDTYDHTNIEIPINCIKEKVLYCLPQNTQIEDDAIIAINRALNHFLKVLAQKIPSNSNEKKKILVKDIKVCIENEKIFQFLKKLTDK